MSVIRFGASHMGSMFTRPVYLRKHDWRAVATMLHATQTPCVTQTVSSELAAMHGFILGFIGTSSHAFSIEESIE